MKQRSVLVERTLQPARATAVHPVALPDESRIRRHYAAADLADAFAVTLPFGAPLEVDRWATAALEHPPLWVRLLVGTGELARKLLRVKPAPPAVEDIERTPEWIGLFPVRLRREDEVIVGELDRHLDFRASLLLRRRPNREGYELVATTVVNCHDALGRACLRVISPFHRLLVRQSLNRAVARLRTD